MAGRTARHKIGSQAAKMAETLHIYLLEPMRSRAEAKEINVFNKMAEALPGWKLRFHEDNAAERLAAPGRGYGLFHMQEPPVPTILCLRRAYHYPFWRIEKTNERWHFDVANATFDPASVAQDRAAAFFARWRPRIFRDGPVARDGFAFLPLQGRLRQHRSFQSQSPVEMIETWLRNRPGVPAKATLHPKELYDDADYQALQALEDRFPDFKLVTEDAKDLLARCDVVVTQNSAVALTGFFAQKPAVLFAGSDFHHIAASVPRDGLAAALQQRPDPDFAAYLFWFFQRQSINASAANAVEKIRARFKAHGFPVSS